MTEPLRSGGSSWRLFLRAAGSGLAIGAVVGTAVGLVAGVLAMDVYGFAIVFGAAFAGLLYGTLTAAIPSVVGAAAVAVTLRARHPVPADPDGVRRDLAIAFALVIGVADVLIVLLVALATPEEASYVLGLVGVLVVLDVVLLPGLWWARRSLTRAWTGDG